MYAVIKTGGKQYQVAVGKKLKVELLSDMDGDKVTFTEVLLLANGDDVVVGKPVVDGASVTATVLGNGRHKKIRIFKMRRRKHYQKHQGHRQHYTEVQIEAINR